MVNREENLKKINDNFKNELNTELEKLSDEELDEVAGGLCVPSYGYAYYGNGGLAIKNPEQLIKGGNKVY